MTVRVDRGVSKVLDEALKLLYYDGWVWRGQRGTETPGWCLGAAVNLANHGRPDHTHEVGWELTERHRTRAANTLRVLLDVIYPEEGSHMSLGVGMARRRVEEWNDVFGRQECEVLAAVRRGAREAHRREEIGLLL